MTGWKGPHLAPGFSKLWWTESIDEKAYYRIGMNWIHHLKLRLVGNGFIFPLLQLMKQHIIQIINDYYNPYGHNLNNIKIEQNIMSELLYFKCLSQIFDSTVQFPSTKPMALISRLSVESGQELKQYFERLGAENDARFVVSMMVCVSLL